MSATPALHAYAVLKGELIESFGRLSSVADPRISPRSPAQPAGDDELRRGSRRADLPR